MAGKKKKILNAVRICARKYFPSMAAVLHYPRISFHVYFRWGRESKRDGREGGRVFIVKEIDVFMYTSHRPKEGGVQHAN